MFERFLLAAGLLAYTQRQIPLGWQRLDRWASIHMTNDHSIRLFRREGFVRHNVNHVDSAGKAAYRKVMVPPPSRIPVTKTIPRWTTQLARWK